MNTQTNASSQASAQQTGATSAAPASGNAAADSGAKGETNDNSAAQGGAGKADAAKGGEGAAGSGAQGDAANAAVKAGDKGVNTEGDEGAGKPANGAPEKYELTLSENSPLPETRKSEIEAMAKEKNWTQEQAQERIQTEEAAIALDRKLENEALNERRNDWTKKIDNDPRFKGEEGKARVEYAKRLIDECASPELKQILKPVAEGGQDLGNYPPLIDLIDNLVEKAGMRESRITTGSPGAPEKSHADILFKDHK